MSQSWGESDYEEPPPPYTANEQTPLLKRQHESTNQPRRSVMQTILGSLLIFCMIVYLGRLLLAAYPATPPVPSFRIAIIGAGPSGVATAFTLAEQFKDNDKVMVDITIFDKSHQIGGRMVLNPNPAVLGAQIHAEDVASGCLGLNRVFRKRAKDHLDVSYGMIGKNVVGGRKDDVAFWDGDGIRSALVRPSGQIGPGLWIKLVSKYGASFWKARKLPKGTVKGWESLVGLRATEKGRLFDGMEEWVTEAGMSGAVSLSAVEVAEEWGWRGLCDGCGKK